MLSQHAEYLRRKELSDSTRNCIPQPRKQALLLSIPFFELCSILGPVLIVLAMGLIALVTYTYFDAMMPALGMAPFSISWCLCTSVGIWILINLVFNYMASIMVSASFVELPGKKTASGGGTLHFGNCWGLFGGGGGSPRPTAAATSKVAAGRGISASPLAHSQKTAGLDELEAGRGGGGATRGLISGGASGNAGQSEIAGNLQQEEHTEIRISSNNSSSSSGGDGIHGLGLAIAAGANTPRARALKDNDLDDSSADDDEDDDDNGSDSDSHDFYDEVTKGDPNKSTHCGKCNVMRPARAHHCQMCDRCVLKMGT